MYLPCLVINLLNISKAQNSACTCTVFVSLYYVIIVVYDYVTKNDVPFFWSSRGAYITAVVTNQADPLEHLHGPQVKNPCCKSTVWPDSGFSFFQRIKTSHRNKLLHETRTLLNISIINASVVDAEVQPAAQNWFRKERASDCIESRQ